MESKTRDQKSLRSFIACLSILLGLKDERTCGWRAWTDAGGLPARAGHSGRCDMSPGIRLAPLSSERMPESRTSLEGKMIQGSGVGKERVGCALQWNGLPHGRELSCRAEAGKAACRTGCGSGLDGRPPKGSARRVSRTPWRVSRTSANCWPALTPRFTAAMEGSAGSFSPPVLKDDTTAEWITSAREL